MGKRDCFNAVMSVVEDLTELSKEDILGQGKTMELVDARWLCVKMLREMGLYAEQIAELMNMTPRNVGKIITNFNDRMMFGDAMLKNYLEIARQRLLN